LGILIDTNIFIYREDFGVVPKELQELLKILATLKVEILIHPNSITEIENDTNAKRREINLSKLSTYPLLESPPDPTLDIFFLDTVGASNNPHDKIDNSMLYAVYRNAVDALISEDKELPKKASRLSLENRVFTVREALTYFTKLLPENEVEQPPALGMEYVYNLDVSDHFFDSLKGEYPGFETWFEKISRQGRKCYVHFQGKTISALLIPKDENEAISCEPPLPAKRRYKLGLFKVERGGNRIGELFIKLATRYCISNNIDEMYFTHYAKEDDDGLVKLAFEYGFLNVGKMPNGEAVYLKSLVPDPAVCETLDPVDIGGRFYPSFYDGKNVRKFIVPIIPKYHDRLFTDDNRGRQTMLTEFSGDFIVEGNTIKKAYLSHTPVQKISEGDVLLFYRSHDRHEITTLGVVEKVYHLNDANKIAEKVKNRTVYDFKEIQEYAKKQTLVLLFRSHFHLPQQIKINKLVELKVLPCAPPTMREIEHEAYLQIKKEGLLDERYTVY